MTQVGRVMDGRQTMGIEILTVRSGITTLALRLSGILVNPESQVGVEKIIGMLTEEQNIYLLVQMFRVFRATKKVVSVMMAVHVELLRKRSS